jgi:hypothetical protein
MSTLERTQAMILRRDERRRGWFWTSREEDELEEVEEEAERPRWATTTRTGVKRRKGLTIRVLWWLLTTVRRAMVDVGVGMLVLLAASLVIEGGWRRARVSWSRVRAMAQRLIAEV